MKWIYIALLLQYLTLKVLRYGSHSVTCKLHRTCLYLVTIHQMAPPRLRLRTLQPTTHLSTPKGRKVKLAWLVDLQRTVYPHKWSPVSCRSSVGQGKFAGQRSTFYRCATDQPNRPASVHDRQTDDCQRFCVFRFNFVRCLGNGFDMIVSP